MVEAYGWQWSRINTSKYHINLFSPEPDGVWSPMCPIWILFGIRRYAGRSARAMEAWLAIAREDGLPPERRYRGTKRTATG